LAKHWVEIKVGEEDTMMLKCIEDVAGRRFSSDRKGKREMWEWMGKGKRVIGHNGTNLFAVFCLSIRRCDF
jgi:hypothetical protein